MAEDVTIRLGVPAQGVPDVTAAAEGQAVDLQVEANTHVLDPITWVLLGGGVVALVKITSDLIERRRGGVIIDLRPGATRELRRSQDAPAGWVFVFAADGTVKIETRDAPRDAMERLLTSMTSGVIKGAIEINEAAINELGPGKASVEPEPSN